MSNRENKARKNAWRFAMQRANAAAEKVRKAIARHCGTQNHNRQWGQRMALARSILAQCQATIAARDRAEAYLYRELGGKRRKE